MQLWARSHGSILSGFDFEEAPGTSAAEGCVQSLSATLFIPEWRQPTVRSALIRFLRAQLSCPTPAFIGG